MYLKALEQIVQELFIIVCLTLKVRITQRPFQIRIIFAMLLKDFLRGERYCLRQLIAHRYGIA